MSGKQMGAVNEQTNPGEAIKIAMQREQAAHDFYSLCAGIVLDPGVKKLFEFLAAEETKHFDLLEREYNRFIASEN